MFQPTPRRPDRPLGGAPPSMGGVLGVLQIDAFPKHFEWETASSMAGPLGWGVVRSPASAGPSPESPPDLLFFIRFTNQILKGGAGLLGLLRKTSIL